MMIKARAPLRIGLAGGGTDLPSFAQKHGGAVLNAAINRYTHATVNTRNDGRLSFAATDIGAFWIGDCDDLPDLEALRLHAGVHGRMVRLAARRQSISLDVTTRSEVPVGSGLGASSALVVSLVHAYAKLLGISSSPAELAHLAHTIERVDLGLPGGRQDHYAAAFGGINLMEFAGDDVSVQRVDADREVIAEIDSILLLYHTGVYRDSGPVSAEQSNRMIRLGDTAYEPYLEMKREAFVMRDSLIAGRVEEVARSLRHGWELKKRASPRAADAGVGAVVDAALDAGAMAAKACGSGSGGHILFLVEAVRRSAFEHHISSNYPGLLSTCAIEHGGSTAWTCSGNPTARR